MTKRGFWMRTEITAQDPLTASLIWLGTIAPSQGSKVVTNSLDYVICP
jgi:hypothetical protein